MAENVIDGLLWVMFFLNGHTTIFLTSFKNNIKKVKFKKRKNKTSIYFQSLVILHPSKLGEVYFSPLLNWVKRKYNCVKNQCFFSFASTFLKIKAFSPPELSVLLQPFRRASNKAQILNLYPLTAKINMQNFQELSPRSAYLFITFRMYEVEV